MEKLYGLIGYPLTHSFSKKYFTEKFEKEQIFDCSYELFPIEDISMMKPLFEKHPNLCGLNVTIPYKEMVLPLLDGLDAAAEKIKAVNVIKKTDGKLIGYNSDYYGFKTSLVEFLGSEKVGKALILGTGGASKAVAVALADLKIDFSFVSRKKTEGGLTYDELNDIGFSDFKLIVNCSPLGTFPNTDECPNLPYERIDESFFLYDLVYNPATTLFMKKGLEKKAKVMNGLPMLIGQAEKAWEIWNS